MSTKDTIITEYNTESNTLDVIPMLSIISAISEREIIPEPIFKASFLPYLKIMNGKKDENNFIIITKAMNGIMKNICWYALRMFTLNPMEAKNIGMKNASPTSFTF